jgi:hypothetical protein
MKPESFTLDTPQNRNHAHRLVDLAVLEKTPWIISFTPVDQAEEAARQMAINLIRAKAKIKALEVQITKLKEQKIDIETRAKYGLQERIK